MAKRTLVVEDPDNEVVVDNIGSCPFAVTLKWDSSKGKLSVCVEQPKVGNPWPIHNMEVPLIKIEAEEAEENYVDPLENYDAEAIKKQSKEQDV